LAVRAFDKLLRHLIANIASMREHNYFVYILASCRNGTLYIGVTNDLERRVAQHREGLASKFTKKYKVTKLVYFEHFDDVRAAIARETQLKKYKRAWKMNLIQRENVEWLDLAAEWYQSPNVSWPEK
jgi:putative endonuclease